MQDTLDLHPTGGDSETEMQHIQHNYSGQQNQQPTKPSKEEKREKELGVASVEAVGPLHAKSDKLSTSKLEKSISCTNL